MVMVVENDLFIEESYLLLKFVKVSLFKPYFWIACIIGTMKFLTSKMNISNSVSNGAAHRSSFRSRMR